METDKKDYDKKNSFVAQLVEPLTFNEKVVGSSPTGGTKKCYTCNQVKSVDDFNKNKGRKDGLNSICRTCSNGRSKKYYRDNKGLHIETVRLRRLRVREKSKIFLREFLSDKSCLDCGNDDIRVLEFDHVKGIKKMDVGEMVSAGYSKKLIRKEIDKCEIVCCNCHRIRTYERIGGSYRTKTNILT